MDEQPPYYVGDWSNAEFYRLPGEWIMEPGHEYCQAAVVTDEYGRERVYASAPPVAYDPEEDFVNYVDVDDISADPADWGY